MSVLRAEWTKLHSLAGTRWTPIAATLSVPVLAVVVGLTDSLPPDDTVLGGALTGATLGQLGAAVLGALVMAGEYSTGLIRATFTATPSRLRVLAAKAMLVATVSFVMGVAGCRAGYLAGLGLLDGHQSGRPWPGLLGFGLAFAAAGLLGLAAATLVRSTAGALALAGGIVVLPAMLAPLLGGIGADLLSLAPAGVLPALAQSVDAVPGPLPPWAALTEVGASALAALALAGLLVHRRDA